MKPDRLDDQTFEAMNFRHRPDLRWQNNPCVRRCGAKARSNGGAPCKNLPVKGERRCWLHGGLTRKRWGRGKNRLPRTKEQLLRRELYMARKAASDERERRNLHPDSLGAYRKTFAGQIPNADFDRFILELDRRIRGELPTRVWLQVLEQFGLRG